MVEFMVITAVACLIVVAVGVVSVLVNLWKGE